MTVGISGSCCLECRGLASCRRGAGTDACWSCLRACLVYPVSFLKLFTAWRKKKKTQLQLDSKTSCFSLVQVKMHQTQHIQMYAAEVVTWRKNLLAMRLSGETSDCLHE